MRGARRCGARPAGGGPAGAGAGAGTGSAAGIAGAAGPAAAASAVPAPCPCESAAADGSGRSSGPDSCSTFESSTAGHENGRGGATAPSGAGWRGGAPSAARRSKSPSVVLLKPQLFGAGAGAGAGAEACCCHGSAGAAGCAAGAAPGAYCP
ncbi:hypothetical protein NS354_08500 [Leucobacter chromiiresistens]|uniref:Uncharacterized protein n=1 Tax=Leucobacter chromiiresistens TaxID=1079994 RepID=A0A147EMP6_9MICO|nr:hypothetical protein NS354_08500 [Leucobacter chromiiresistens]